jgi:long-chain acyl-CoA synthetase
MRKHLASLLDDFRRFDRGIAVVRIQGNRRRVTTYGEIAQLAGRFGALLDARGIGAGDRVVLWAENSAEWVAAFYGILLRGALAVPLDAYGSTEFAARVSTDVKPKLIVGDSALLGRLNAWFSTPSSVSEASSPRTGRRDLERQDLNRQTLAFEDWLACLPTEQAGPVAGLGPETPLQILFTSGTTGEPKGIVHTHGNVLASVGPIELAAQSYLRYERLVHPLRFLLTLPLSHVFGQTMGLWVPAIFAAEVHFESRLVAPRLLETIKRERISVLAAVPRVIGLLKAHLEATRPGLEQRIAASQNSSAWMRWWRFRDVHRALGLKFWALISGGGALPGPLEHFWNALGLVVVQGYGMTETTALITLNHPFHVASGTIGKPLPGREVKLGPDGEVLVRGPMISSATWTGGELRQTGNEWLATGDLAEEQTTGELKFLGRKSEVIVTASGVNIHPEDLEAAIEREPGVVGCAVVPMETANGPEPFAVLAVRGAGSQAAVAVEHANERLAEFQQVRRWALWPEPDLPRTSTGKVRRKAIALWLAGAQTTNGKGEAGVSQFSAGRDWLLALIAETTGEAPSGVGDELRLSEDLHLDSLGRVQLAAAIEERLGELPAEHALDQVRTLGELRNLIGGERTRGQGSGCEEIAIPRADGPEAVGTGLGPQDDANPRQQAHAAGEEIRPERYLYPHWPWWTPVAWARCLFLELIAQPLVCMLANPRVVGKLALPDAEPMLIIGNHVTAFDGPLVQYALPGPIRRRIAAAMSGEMLEDYRHFRNPEHATGQRRFFLFGPLAYFLVTSLFNVFPLPRRRDFQKSFAHAGEALDHGYNVLVFPEGTRSAEGKLAQFRPGIGLLVKQSQAAVLPVAIRGLGELKARGRGWLRSGTIEVHVGEPVRFAPRESEAAITARLHAEVEKLLGKP